MRCEWIGRKGYWVLSLFSNITILVINIIDDNYLDINQQITEYYEGQTILYSFAIFFDLVLSIYAFFKPDDFIFNLRDNNKKFITPSEETNEKKILVSMSGYKIKEINNNKVIYYDIIVFANGSTHKVSRTYNEFDEVNKAILNGMNSDLQPNIILPELPNFYQKNLSLEEKTAALGDYLNSFCAQSYFSLDLLEFLKIEGTFKESVIKNFQKLFDIGAYDTLPRSESALFGYYSSKQQYKETLILSIPAYHLNWMIDIHIPNWKNAGTYIEYTIKSEIRVLSFESILTTRFSEIFNLHKQLKKKNIPTPAFPQKYLYHKPKNLEAHLIEIRRAQLEEYLGNIFNDPAYLSESSLKFINCNIKISEILRLIPNNSSYELIIPITWEEELGGDLTPFIKYHMKFRKLVDASEVEWDISRRFREFDELNKVLVQRNGSFLLKEFLKTEVPNLPSLPKKSFGQLCVNEEIEQRKRELESYMLNLIKNPAVTCCYHFRTFIGEI